MAPKVECQVGSDLLFHDEGEYVERWFELNGDPTLPIKICKI